MTHYSETLVLEQNETQHSVGGSLLDRYQLGDGISAYESGDIRRNPFQTGKLDVVKGSSESNAFESYCRVFNSIEEYHNSQESTRGLNVNLGFFKLGHKKSKEVVDDVSSHTVILCGQATRSCGVSRFNEDDLKGFIKDEAKGLDPKTFYDEYGCQYVSEIVWGYYAKVLVKIQTHSHEHAEGVKKELEAAIKSDEGEGDFSWKNAKATKNKLKELGGVQVKMHNMHGLEEHYEGLEVLNYLDLVEGQDPAKCDSAISVSLSRYPIMDGFNASEYGLGDGTTLHTTGEGQEENLSLLRKLFVDANKTLDEIAFYEKYSSNYEWKQSKGHSPEKVKEHCYDTLDMVEQFTTKINHDPQSTEAAALFEKIEGRVETSSDYAFDLMAIKLSIKGEYAQNLFAKGYAQKGIRFEEIPFAPVNNYLYSVFNELPLWGVYENSQTVKEWKTKVVEVRPTSMPDLVNFLNTLEPWQYLNASYQYLDFYSEESPRYVRVLYPEGE